MEIKLNKEYARRHLFVTVLMIALGCWFGYDGLVTYPSQSPAELYRAIEKTDPPAEWDDARLEAFKRQKTQTQYSFAALGLLAGAVVGLRLLWSARFSFDYDETGFSVAGARYTREDIASVDRSKWASKSILTLRLKNGKSVCLDAWHHEGVKEFAATV